MIILGIDPGTASTGFGAIEVNGSKINLKGYGCIRTSPQLGLEKRLQKIYQEVSGLIEGYKPKEFAIEQLFFNTNTKTALAVGQARGVAILAAADKNLKSAEYTPLQVKQAVVGYGQARKEQVQYMVKILLGLEKSPKPDDAADALALAICHAHARGIQRKVKKLN